MPLPTTTRRKPSPPTTSRGLAPTRFKVSGLRPAELDLSDPQQYACARAVFFSRHVRPLAETVGEPLSDAFQECLCGLLRRQRSPGSKYDPTRASLASYLGVVFRSLLLHYRAHERHLRSPDRLLRRAEAYAASRGLSVSDAGDELVVECDQPEEGPRPSFVAARETALYASWEW